MASHALPASAGPVSMPSMRDTVQAPAVSLYRPSVPMVAARQTLSLSGRALALGAVIVLHLFLFAALLTIHFTGTSKPVPEPMLLVDIPVAPPPPREAPKLVVETPPVIIPPPVIEIAERPPTITAVVMEHPPAQQPDAAPVNRPVVEGPPGPPAPRPPATVSGGDLSSSMIEAVPPRYPYESRRLKEQGVVTLDVLVGPDGRVDTIGIQSSSGHHRLDKAALDAVRRWRWSPTTRDGEPVPVRGLVRIPFQLTARG